MWERTNLAIDVEHTPAVVDGDGGGPVEPRTEPADPGIEGREEPPEEEEELDEVEADERVPEEAPRGVFGLGARSAGAGRTQGQGRRTHLVGSVRRADAHDVRLGEPPEAHVLGAVGNPVEVLRDVVKWDGLLCLLQTKRGAHLELDLEDEAGAAEPAERREEEVGVCVAGAADAGAVGEEQREGLDVRGDDLEVHAGAVGGGGDDAGEGLVGDGAEVDHGEAAGGEGGMEGVEGDAALGDDEALLGVDLCGRDGEHGGGHSGGGHGRAHTPRGVPGIGGAIGGPRRSPRRDKIRALTWMILSRFSVLSMKADVQARSLGLWPTPAARTVRPSRRASSSTRAQSCSDAGAKTASGAHSKLRPQLMKRALSDDEGTVMGCRRR